MSGISLVCMGHEPDLAAALQEQVKYKLDIEVLDILRDKSNLEFKRDSEAEIVKEDGKLVIKQFYPMNLLQLEIKDFSTNNNGALIWDLNAIKKRKDALIEAALQIWSLDTI